MLASTLESLHPTLTDRQRDKDEDDEQWWRRCIARSAAMMRQTAERTVRWVIWVSLIEKISYK